MTPPSPVDDTNEASHARAEGGSCHGHRWTVLEREPLTLIELLCPGGIELYRLVRDPRTRAAMRDEDGYWVYVPLNEPPPGRKVLPFRRRD